MSRPRFLADNDLNEHLRTGVWRREPLIEFPNVREMHLGDATDPEILEFAAAQGLILVSHDVNTMPSYAFQRLQNGDPIAGLIIVHQRRVIAPFIDDLVLIWSASEGEEWTEKIVFLPL